MNIYEYIALAVFGGVFGGLLLMGSYAGLFVIKDMLTAWHWNRKCAKKASSSSWEKARPDEIKPIEESLPTLLPIEEMKITTTPLEELKVSSIRTKHTLHRIELARYGQGDKPTSASYSLHKRP